VETQLVGRGIGDARVLAAMRRVPRELFVPEHERDLAYADAALALASGQTISQPFVVALICQALELKGHERVLDVGTGSGYQAAVLAELAGEVVSVEVLPELSAQAARNLEAAGYTDRVELRLGNGRDGVADRAPFGGIAVAAASAEPPPALVDQLAEGARLVLPLGEGRDQWLVAIERHDGARRARALTPVRFVPLVD
jgi:protein-L-isoaspartate(D-aspartate) O-methyltransferase